jgi:hypothetical protein
MKRLGYLLVFVAVLYAQFAYQQHALSHAVREVAAAGQPKEGLPPLDHKSSQCVAYQAIGSAVSNASALPVCQAPFLEPALPQFVFTGIPSRIVFDSRAPPLSA